MSTVIGPNSYLPGRVLSQGRLVENYTCDECEAKATKAIIAETDSFGSEVMHFCGSCYAQFEERHKASMTEPQTGYCDHCRAVVDNVQPTRDPGEGSTGPVYYLCPVHSARLVNENADR